MARKYEEHTRLHKDFLLLSALIKNHKAQRKPDQNDKSQWKPHGTYVEQPNPCIRHLPNHLHPSTQTRRFNLPNKRYSYKRSRQTRNDQNGLHGMDPPQALVTLRKPVPTAGDPSVMATAKTASPDIFPKSGKSDRCSSFPQKPAKLHQPSTSQRSHLYKLKVAISNDSPNYISTAGNRKQKHLKTSFSAPGKSDSGKRIVTVLPNDKISQKVKIAPGHSLPGSAIANTSSSLNIASHYSGRNYSMSKSIVGKNAKQSKNDSQDNRNSPSLRMDAIRTACLESFAALEKTKHLGSTSEQLQNKDCEVARIKALSAFLNQLDRQKGNPFVGREAVSSSHKGSTTQAVTEVSQRGNVHNTISPKNSPMRGNANAKDIPSEPQVTLSDQQVQGGKRMEAQQTVPSENFDKATSTQQQIQGLRNDIKRLEEMLSKNMAATVNQTERKGSQKPIPTVHAQGRKLKSTKLTNHGNRYKMTRKRMPNMKKVSKESYSLHKQNPFKKLNSSVNSASTGSRSLHKTRSRYKVRKSALSLSASERVSHGQARLTNRRGLRKDVPVANQSSLRPSKLTKHFPLSPKSYQRIEHQWQSPRYGSPVSHYRTQHKHHKHLDKRYSLQFKKYGHVNWRGLWNNPNNPTSFVSRRLQHVAAHSPMLYRAFPLSGRNFRHHHLGGIWHSPKLWANRLRWQPLPQRLYSCMLTPRRGPSRPVHHSPSAESRRWLRHSCSKHSTAVKAGNKKVMNVVKLGGVRYARRGKSLQRLAKLQDGGQIAGSRGHRLHHQEQPPSSTAHRIDRKITNTKIVAQQVLQRSIFYNRLSQSRKKHRQEYCMFYNRFGRCNKGTSCPYKHDPDKVAVCTRFLRGTCKPTGGPCPFSHKVSRDKMPVCRFFLRGICAQADCPYSHVKVNNSASVCRDFVRGFCPRGEKCTQKHLLECAEFTEKGRCSRKHCPLWHKKGRKQSTGGHPKGRKTAWKRVPKAMNKSNRGPDDATLVDPGKSEPSLMRDRVVSNEAREHTTPLISSSTLFKTSEKDTQTKARRHVSHEELEKDGPIAVSGNASYVEEKEEQAPTSEDFSSIDRGRRSKLVESDNPALFDVAAKRIESPVSDSAYSIQVEEGKPSEIVGNASFIELEKDEEHVGLGETESITEEVPQPPLQIRPIFLKTKR